MSLLSIQNITKKYSGHTALDDVSLEIPSGSIFGLLGPNGAGKTSLIRIITQITAGDEGKVLFEGDPLGARHISLIGYLPEERGLYKKMEIWDQAMYFARLKGLDRKEAAKRINYWFDKFDIQSWKRKKVEELSKGMQQKVQFIITLLHEPKLVILDEPFSGFDPINADIIKKEILEIRDKGTTILFSTHRMESVEQICDHIALFNKAKKVLDGSVKDIKNQFKDNIFRCAFTGTYRSGDPRFEIIDEQFSDREQWSEVLFKIKEGVSSNHLLTHLVQQVEVLNFNEVIPTIHDIFVSKVKEEQVNG